MWSYYYITYISTSLYHLELKAEHILKQIIQKKYSNAAF